MDLGGRSLLNKNSDNEYRFSHYSIQEFLLARGILFSKIKEYMSVRFTDRIYNFLTSINDEKIFHKAIDYRGANLSGQCLDGVSVPDMDFNGVNFTNSSFIKACLSGTNLSNAKMGRAILVKENLSNANLSGANLKESNLSEANLESSNMSRTDMRKAKAIGANLSNADLSFSKIGEADLSYAKTFGTNIEGIYSGKAKLTGTSILSQILAENEKGILQLKK